jgi:hypothetical protein
MLMTAVTDDTDEETDELESTTDDEEAQGPQLREITKILRQLYRKSARSITDLEYTQPMPPQITPV